MSHPTNDAGIPTRPFGRHPEHVSLIGLGGYHSTDPTKLTEAASHQLIRRAVDEGITFLDNAWCYHDGLAEERMGRALDEGKIRDKVFLMSKCCGRTAQDAQSCLEDSLRRLKTDHLDLWQLHEMCYDNDPEWISRPGGALEYAAKAKEQGKIRHLGFTGHKDPSIHLEMLTKDYEWDSSQLPLNVMDAHYRSFQHKVVPRLAERGIAVIGMKSLGGAGQIVSEAGVTVEEALTYVFSLPIATLVSGIDSEKILDQNLKIIRGFQPLSAVEMAAIERKVVDVAGDGRFELFKSAKTFDGPFHRKQHGFEVEAA